MRVLLWALLCLHQWLQPSNQGRRKELRRSQHPSSLDAPFSLILFSNPSSWKFSFLTSNPSQIYLVRSNLRSHFLTTSAQKLIVLHGNFPGQFPSQTKAPVPFAWINLDPVTRGALCAMFACSEQTATAESNKGKYVLTHESRDTDEVLCRIREHQPHG